MKKHEKQEYLNMKTVGIYSYGLTGLSVKSIEYGIDDYIVFVDKTGGNVHKCKLYYTGKNVYFKHNGRRIKTDEILRTF